MMFLHTKLLSCFDGVGYRGLLIRTTAVARFIECPLMGWSGRAPAPPAIEVGKGAKEGACHVSEPQQRDNFLSALISARTHSTSSA
jgi:hypothetical protein